MPALIGKYEYSLDPKNRMFIPPRYRTHLAEEKGLHFILSLGLDQCLYLFLPSQWERLISDNQSSGSIKDKRKLRAFKRQLFSSAIEAPLDDQGRILIPPSLMDHAGLGKEVIVAGTGTKAEIWDKRRWSAKEKVERKVLQQLSADLDI